MYYKNLIKSFHQSLQSHHLAAYNACHQFPNNKNSEVGFLRREFLQRIIGQYTVAWVKQDLQILESNSQLGLGQKRGIEYAIHTLRFCINQDNND